MRMQKQIKIGVSFIVLLFYYSLTFQAQYEDNPLKDKKWLELSVGANSADNGSWQVLGSWATRGDFFVSQMRAGLSEQLRLPQNDSLTFKKSRIAEFAYLLGDGYGGKHWYASGGIGFGLNIRMYNHRSHYQWKYITAISPAISGQIDAGILLGKKWGLGVSMVGNLNFREPYYGLLFGLHYRLEE